MSPQHIGPEQKEQFRQQVIRSREALELKERQIVLKRERAVLLRVIADSEHVASDAAKLEGGVGEEKEYQRWSKLHNSEAAGLENDARLLELDFEEFVLLQANLEATLKAVESGLVIPGTPMPRHKQHR